MTNQEQDELVLAAIIAGGESSGRTIIPALCYRPVSSDHRNCFGVEMSDSVDGPCCAIGAGVLFGGITLCSSAIESFADLHDVSLSYADGVSAGFEQQVPGLTWFPIIKNRRDFNRGYAVGDAVYDYFYSDAGD